MKASELRRKLSSHRDNCEIVILQYNPHKTGFKSKPVAEVITDPDRYPGKIFLIPSDPLTDELMDRDEPEPAEMYYPFLSFPAIRCPKCGGRLRKKDLYCPMCGQKIDTEHTQENGLGKFLK